MLDADGNHTIYHAPISKEDFISDFENQTLDMLREKIYATGRIRRCALNNMKMDALFSAMLLIRPRYEAEHNREVDALMLSMIAHFKAD